MKQLHYAATGTSTVLVPEDLAGARPLGAWDLIARFIGGNRFAVVDCTFFKVFLTLFLRLFRQVQTTALHQPSLPFRAIVLVSFY